MNFEQLSGLIKAGFTEEQIRNIGTIMGTGTGTNTNTPTPTPTPTPTATPTPTDKPTDNPTTTPADKPGESTDGGTQTSAAQSPKAESETVTLLKEMLGLIQKGNINGVGTGTIPEQTGADVLAEILNPTPKTK